MRCPERPEAVLPDRALYFPTFSHFLIVNTFFSHSFSRTRALSFSRLSLSLLSALGHSGLRPRLLSGWMPGDVRLQECECDAFQ